MTSFPNCRHWLPMLLMALLAGCQPSAPPPGEVVMTIASSPNSLDPRQGTDAQSERIGALVFDSLVRKDEHFNLQPWLATAWEQPDPLTWVIHLRDGVRFHDGRPLEAEDVAWTLRSMTDGTMVTSKGGAFAAVERIEVPGRLTIVLHLRRPDAGLLFNLSDGLFGVIPRDAPRDFGLHPVGSGAFRFVSEVRDKDVLLERNPAYWSSAPRVARVRFAVVPDAITTALELQKGSADVESNDITLDMVHALHDAPRLATETGPSSVVVYANFNVQDPVLRDGRVRQAIACAMDRQAVVDALWRGRARLAATLLPPEHWAAADASTLPRYPHDLVRAEALLEAAGYPRKADGIRLHLTLKTSTDETIRLLGTILQQQLRGAGIDLALRSSEFGTFYADVTRGAFQMYILRWIGSNEDPDIFRYAYGTASFPPKGGNRGRYSNPALDALLVRAGVATTQDERRRLYLEAQRLLAEDLPGIPLWYPDNNVVHSRRLEGVVPRTGGGFDFLREATLR